MSSLYLIFVPCCIWHCEDPYPTPGESWHRVYGNNQEPYAPVEECTVCGLRWLAKQATHTDPKCTQLDDKGSIQKSENPET